MNDAPRRAEGGCIPIVGVTRSGKSTLIRAFLEAWARMTPTHVMDLDDAYPGIVHRELPIPNAPGGLPIVFRPRNIIPRTPEAFRLGALWAMNAQAKGGLMVVDEVRDVCQTELRYLPHGWARPVIKGSKYPVCGIVVSAQRAVFLHPEMRGQAKIFFVFRQQQQLDIDAIAAMLPAEPSPMRRILPTLPNLPDLHYYRLDMRRTDEVPLVRSIKLASGRAAAR